MRIWAIKTFQGIGQQLLIGAPCFRFVEEEKNKPFQPQEQIVFLLTPAPDGSFSFSGAIFYHPLGFEGDDKNVSQASKMQQVIK